MKLLHFVSSSPFIRDGCLFFICIIPRLNLTNKCIYIYIYPEKIRYNISIHTTECPIVVQKIVTGIHSEREGQYQIHQEYIS